MPRSGKTRRVLSNDDGWVVSFTDYPLTPEKLWDNMIGPYEGSPVDGFLWSVGGHVFHFETDIGERFGDGYDELDEPRAKNQMANVQYLIDNHGGPMTVISKLCRRAGMDFFPSVRMNQHYDTDISSPSYGRLRREHPELLIGRVGEELAKPSIEWGIRTGKNYAFPEVRSYMSSVIVELVERFDVDGIELDFMRHPAFFRIEEAYSNRYLMTDLVRYVRGRMDEIGTKKGRPLDLIARVPPTLGDCARIGLDVQEWIKEDLVDVLIAGGGFRPFEMPIREFVEAAEGTNCQVYGCLEALRPTVDRLTMRAVAARYWSSGVDGLYLFNFNNMSGDWKRDVLGNLVDKEALAWLDKRYEMDKSARFRPTSQLHLSFLNAIPQAQTPLVPETTLSGRGAVLRMDIADDLEGAKARCALGLMFDNLGDGDVVEVSLNSMPLAWSEGRISSEGWSREAYAAKTTGYPAQTAQVIDPGTSVEFDVGAPPLRHGTNEIEVRLVERGTGQDEKLVLTDVRLEIRYGQAA